MDWQQLIEQFEPLKNEDLMLFAPPRDMEQAVNSYNRVIFNINHDSMDIALIALRKLTATYPMFAHASLMLGCCQALAGQYDEALEQFDHALLSGLPDDWQDQAQRMRDEAENQRKLRGQLLPNSNGGSSTAPTEASSLDQRMISVAAVLEKSRRHVKVRLASEKERQSVIRQGEFPSEEQTRVQIEKDPVEYLRIIIPAVAGLVVVLLLVIAGIRWLPGVIRAGQERREAATRLEWLTDRLNSLSGQDAAIAGLLQDYQAYIAPTPTPAPTTTASESAIQTSQSAAIPTTLSTTNTPATAATTSAQTAPPTVEPAAAPAILSLQQANGLYQQALALQANDLKTAGDNLLAARRLLADIPALTTAPSVTGDAAAISRDVENLIEIIGRDAAELFRVPGMDEFDNKKNYGGALVYFLKAYQLYPKAYGGGVAYYCGRCYQLLGDKTSAKPYYDYVIANFSGRDIAASAAVRLKEMGY